MVLCLSFSLQFPNEIFNFRSQWVDRDSTSHLLKGEIPFAFLTHFFNNTTYSVMRGLWIIQVKKSLIYQRDTWDSRKADVDWLFYFLILTAWYFISRYLSRFFDCLAHPNLSPTFGTDHKWPLSHHHIYYQSLADCHTIVLIRLISTIVNGTRLC